MFEQRTLGGGELADVGRSDRPARMRISLPGANTAARGVDEDPVEFGFRRGLRRTVPDYGTIVEKLGARGATFQSIKTTRMTVAGPHDTFVSHQICQMQRLAAFARAGVPPHLARLRRSGQADKLRGEILNLKCAVGELRSA